MLEEANKSLKNELMEDMKTETKLNEKIRFLEQCLDNKEKVNISLREDNKKLKEERDFFKEQAILWRNDYKNKYEENNKLKDELQDWFRTVWRDEAHDRDRGLHLRRYSLRLRFRTTR